MKKLLLLLIALAPIVGSAQCRFSTEEVDKFTGKEVLITRNARLVSKMSNTLLFRATRIDGRHIFVFEVDGREIQSFRKGDKVHLLDNEGESYEFTILQDVLSEGRSTGGYGNLWNADLQMTYNGDLSDLEDLKITDVRIETSDAFLDFSIKKRNAKKISETIKCVI